MPNVLDLRRADDPSDVVHRAVQVLAEGGVIAVPTDTTYALAACGLAVEPVERVCTEWPAAGSSGERAISLSSCDAAADFIEPDQMLARRLAKRCWPGPVILEVDCRGRESAAQRLPESVRAVLMNDSGDLAMRVVGHPLIEQLHRFLAGPLVLVSPVAADSRPVTTCQGILELVGDSVPLLLDDGPTRYGGAATRVSVRGNCYQVQHEGVVESAAIDKFAKPLIALVCTGNTCRSPMAEVLFKQQLRDSCGREDAAEIISAGIAAYEGDQASGQAVEIMKQRGLDLSGHASRPMTEQLLHSADVILTMTRGHRDAILSRFPEAADRVFTLRVDGGDIADPVGAPLEVYKQCADQIDGQLKIWVERLKNHWDEGAQS